MKAIVKQTPEPGGLALVQRPKPTPSDTQVLVKIKKTAICGTDIHIYNWDAWASKTIRTPQIIGHEFVGEVIDVGKHVTNVKVGQLVSGEGHIVCQKCRHCITGHPHLCRQTVGIGVNMDGVFSEYIAFPAENIWVCDENISLDVLSVLDPLGNATHTALSFNVLGEDVLITGAGPIGLMSIPIIKRAGARHIVVTDINPTRLKMAKELGATTTVDVRHEKLQDVVKSLKSMTEGFDVGLEMSGSASAFSDMLDTMANGGKMAILGILPEDTLTNWNKVIFNSLTMKGIYGRQMYDTWYRMSALLQSGLDNEIEKIITHRYHYQDFAKAFEVMRSGDSGKVILDWD
ncbi:MAG: L-threonine 3-dehydrogenase [Defluviitaleaceae bacterium]|nr:L-threonine 3-dehydrogenase [Defluviitaleaceae bacterium]